MEKAPIFVSQTWLKLTGVFTLGDSSKLFYGHPGDVEFQSYDQEQANWRKFRNLIKRVNSPQGPPRAWWRFPDNMGSDQSANAKILDGQIFCATHSPRTERR